MSIHGLMLKLLGFRFAASRGVFSQGAMVVLVNRKAIVHYNAPDSAKAVLEIEVPDDQLYRVTIEFVPLLARHRP